MPDLDVILAILFVVFVVALLFWSMWRPIKIVGRVAVGMVAGGAAIFAINLIAGLWGYNLPLNPVSALVVGLLGAPGLLVVAALAWML